MKTNNLPVDAAIETLGGPTKAAKALGIENPSVVMNWKARRQVPANKAIEVEELTGISRHVLRPDIFGAPDPSKPPEPKGYIGEPTPAPRGWKEPERAS